MEKPLIVCIRDPTHVNSSCSTQVSEKVDEKLRAMLPGEHAHIFEVGPVRVTLGLCADGDGEDGDSDDLVARDKSEADVFLSEGFQAGRLVDPEKALAGIVGIRTHRPGSYNNSSRLHAIEAMIMDGDGRELDYHDLSSYDGVPGVHLLIKRIQDAMDIGNKQTCGALFLAGKTSVSKTGLLKSVVGKVFNKGVVLVNFLEQISGVNEAIAQPG